MALFLMKILKKIGIILNKKTLKLREKLIEEKENQFIKSLGLELEN